MYGADVNQLEGLAQRFALAADQLDRIRASTRGNLHAIRWNGTDAEFARRVWETKHGPALGNAARELRQAADRLRRNANEQETASTSQTHGGGASYLASGAGGVTVALPAGLTKEKLDELVEMLFAANGIRENIDDIDDLTNLVVALLGGTKELKALQAGHFPYLAMAFYGGEAAYWGWSQGIDDARAWDPAARAGLTGAAFAVAGPPGAIAAGAGFFVADRINDAFRITTGQSLSDHMADGALSQEIGDIERRSAANEIDRSMSDAELSRRADEANRIAQDAHRLTEKTKTPWGCISVMLGG